MSDLGPEDLRRLIEVPYSIREQLMAAAQAWQRDREQLAREQAAVDWTVDWFHTGKPDNLPPEILAALEGRKQQTKDKAHE